LGPGPIIIKLFTGYFISTRISWCVCQFWRLSP